MAQLPTSLFDAAPPPPPPPIGGEPRRADGRPFLGRAVQDGKIRFSSVSQVTVFDPTTDGGCPRKWAFKYIFGKKELETDKQRRGKEFATTLEMYLKTGQDTLPPILRVGIHLLPKPGPDLEVEQKFGDIARAVALREQFLRAAHPAERESIAREMRMVAGLSAADVPFDGAPDFRHRRGEYVETDGTLVREAPGLIVCETGDHKTTSRIDDHTTRGGETYQGWAKTPEGVGNTPQMVGYGVNSADKYPDLTHVRLSHIYYQTKGAKTATKRSVLIPVDVVRRRWERVGDVMREMESVAAGAKRIEDVPFNLNACEAFSYVLPDGTTKRGCAHQSYCDRPARTISEFLQIGKREPGAPSLFDAVSQGADTSSQPGEKKMGLFDMVAGTTPGANGTAAPSSPSLFSAPPPPPPPPMGEAERQSAIDAHKARLSAQEAPSVGRHPLEGMEGYTAGQGCNGHGYYQSADKSGFLAVERGHSCIACQSAPPAPSIASVNPPDRPAPEFIDTVDPLPAETIAALPEGELKQKAEAHAKESAKREAEDQRTRDAASGKKEKTSGKCGGGGQLLALKPEHIKRRKIDCPVCGKTLAIADKNFSADFASATLPGHMMTKETKETVAPPPPAPAATVMAAPPPPPPPADVAPAQPKSWLSPAPVTAAPPPPPPPPAQVIAEGVALLKTLVPAVPPPPAQDYVAPGALPGQTAMPEVSALPVATATATSASLPPPPRPLVITGEGSAPSLAGISLFVDVAFDRGPQPASLEDWYLDIVRTIEQQYQLPDIRLAPNTSDLGYGKWKGYLAATVRSNVPKAGEYAIRGAASNEIVQVIVEALSPLCSRVVRGGAR